MNMPMTVKALRFEQVGGPEVLQWVDVPLAAPSAGEIRVRHEACGVNFIDVYHRSGLYPLPLPHGLGMEAAGVVEAVGGGVSHLTVGDRVAYASAPPGSYAQARVMPARNVVRLPEDLSFEQGAAMMLKGMTVQYLLRQTLPHAGLKAGDFVLFHAAAGGVGLIACQWAKALGLQLIGTAGSAEKCELARAHGAAHVIDYRRENFAERVREITQGRGVNVVYDSVGKDTWEGSLDCLAPLGLMVSFGNASGPVPPISLAQLGAKGSLYVTRPSLFTHLATQASTQAMADDLFAVVRSGAVKIPVTRRYPLQDAAQAHLDMEGRSTTGCAVLLP